MRGRMAEIARCPKCSVSIDESFPYSWCAKCGEPLPKEIQARLPAIITMRARSSQASGAPSIQPSGNAREAGVVFSVVGFVLLILGALRWNSAASQLVRTFGGSDTLGVVLLLGGAVGLALGLYLYASGQVGPSVASVSTPVQGPVAKLSVEARIRELADLQSKGLITQTEFDEKRRDLINSI